MPQHSRQEPPQAPQTSPKAAPQADPPPSSPQQDRAPPRPLHQADKAQDRAPPRPASHSRQANEAAADSKGNPFATQARQQRRAAAIAGLREQRGQPQPQGDADRVTPAEGQTETRPGTSPDPNNPPTPPDQDKPSDAALATLQAQYQEREAKLQAAEAKIRDAHTAAEKKAAQAEAREAKAEAHLKRLEMLRGDPAQFLAEAGITEEEFKRYLATGGKPTSEQQRIAENEKQLAAMREEMAKVRAEASESVAALRREREEAEFARELSKDDYTLVNTMGGLPAVRAKQAALRETLGKDVTLSDAAGQLEHEWNHGFKELLKNQAVRAKLGLDVSATATPTPEPSKAAPTRTLNGSLSSTTSHKSDSLAWNDWRGKKERVLRDLARARGN